jgi:hypothetical protein
VVGIPLAAILALVWVRFQRNRHARAEMPSSPVESLYVRMSWVLAHAGFRRAGYVTPREFSATVPAAAREPVEAVTGLFERTRYGGHAATPDEIVAAERRLRELAEHLGAKRR